MTTGQGATRGNEEWLKSLRASGQQQAAAIADLRRIILTALPSALAHAFPSGLSEFDAFAEDVAQETLLLVLRSLDSFAGRSQFTTWTHKIAVNVAWTELRRRRWKDVSLDALLNDAGESRMPPAREDPSVSSEQADLLRIIGRIMTEELTEKQHQAMVAHLVHGMPLEEVARRMGTNRNAMYKLLHDARVRLKRRLEQEGLTPDDVLASFAEG